MRLRKPTQAILEAPFRLDSLVEVASPNGDEGTWYRYVIAQGGTDDVNTITGTRSGTRAEVGLLVQQMVERLNERFGKQQAKLR